MFLFVAQEANFQPRWMVVPLDKFCQVRINDFQALHNAAEIDEKFGKVIYETHHWNKPKGTMPNFAKGETSRVSDIIQTLKNFADGDFVGDFVDGDFVGDECPREDQSWYNESIGGIGPGFDACEIFRNLKTRFSPTESILVLDKHLYPE